MSRFIDIRLPDDTPERNKVEWVHHCPKHGEEECCDPAGKTHACTTVAKFATRRADMWQETAVRKSMIVAKPTELEPGREQPKMREQYKGKPLKGSKD